ncbi:MAG: lipoate--protein ligase family protein [Planctomycetaceae bacterium]|nr:lipoate--protein ligase family protein [Planctomycetaceae bacterium]
MTSFIRLLPFAAADGPTNMAADEALLESACEHGVASLRFYTWTEPTVTLGYFQPSEARALPNLSGLAWVRRSTGGATIVHHHEVTYSFALPAAAQRKSPEPWICRFHRLIRAVLATRGVQSQLVVCGEEVKRGDVLCFLHHTAGDLAINGSKVAGSAQRKLRGAILQHGSLLLRRSAFAPDLPGVNDFAPTAAFTPEELAHLLTVSFAAECGTTVEPSNWTDEELARIPEIKREKYANPEWNARR